MAIFTAMKYKPIKVSHMGIGQQIKRFREAKGVSRYRLCKDLGFCFSTIRSLEEEIHPVRTDVVEDICKYLGLTLQIVEAV